MVHSTRAQSANLESSSEDESEVDVDLSELFREDGKPVYFFLYRLTEERQKVITDKILSHGGRVTRSEAGASVILVQKPLHYELYHDKYNSSKTTWVETSGFVDRCINRGRYEHIVTQAAIAGGRRRVEFTDADEDNLCKWLALRVPYKEYGGRGGNGLYQDLVERAQKYNQCIWAERHTWQSWREHYQKNADRLDSIIEDLVKADPPRADGKGQYGYRRSLGAPKPGRRKGYNPFKRKIYFSSDEEDAEDVSDEISKSEGERNGGDQEGISARKQVGERIGQEEEEEEEEKEEGEREGEREGEKHRGSIIIFSSDEEQELNAEVEDERPGEFDFQPDDFNIFPPEEPAWPSTNANPPLRAPSPSRKARPVVEIVSRHLPRSSARDAESHATTAKDAPFRNTRARSRSVEPPERTVKKQKLSGASRDRGENLPLVREVKEADTPEGDDTTQEIASVEAKLFGDEGDVDGHRGQLSADDRQTSERLHKIGGRTQRGSAATSRTRITKTRASGAKPINPPESLSPTSSSEIFPSPDTRARDEADRRESAAKQQPYIPPAGTRASQYLSTQSSRRTRKK